MKFTTTILSAGLAASCNAVNLNAQAWWDDVAEVTTDIGNGIADGLTDAANATGDWFTGDFADFWTDDLPDGIEDLGNDIAGGTMAAVGDIA